jgi:CPA2 family monovalent cation:H+ antiporter-2
METVHGQVSLGILIVQDIALGLMLAVLPALDSPQAVGQAVLRALLVTALFAGAAIAFGRWCIPSLLRWVASTESKELFLLFKAVPVILQGCQRVPPLSRWLDREQLPQAIAVSASQTNHVIVCGYGKVGQNIVSLLLARHYPTVVIEQSEAKVQLLRDRGIPYVYGNCASAHVLEAAGIRQARSLVLVVSDPIASKLCLREALKLAPQLDVVARACQDSDIDLLYQLGAKEVVHPEFEASLELSTHLLLVLGESPQTVEREVRTVRQSRYADFRPDIACPLPELILSSPE